MSQLVCTLLGLAIIFGVFYGIPYLIQMLREGGKSVTPPPDRGLTQKGAPASDPKPEQVLSAEDRQLLQTAREACLAIKHVFPPRHPRRSLSFLGGQPMGPDDFEWPMVLNTEGLLEWLPFAGQINCADIPPGKIRALLPAEGVLYFFLPFAGMVTEENEKLAVKYISSRPSAQWKEHQGLVLPPLNGLENARYQFRWLNWHPDAGRRYPTSYPRNEIELGWVDYGGEVFPEDPDSASGLPWEVAAARHRANLVAFHGEPVPHDSLLSPHGKPTDHIWRVHDGFPLSWDAIAVVGGHLRVLIQAERVALEKGGDLPNSPENLTALYDRLEARLSKLMSWTFRGVEEPSPADKAEFWELLESLLTDNQLPLISERSHRRDLGLILNKELSEAAIISAEACLNHPEAAGRVPLEVINALRQRHAVLQEHMFKDKGWHIQHQILGRGDVIQEAADRMSETHLLLLQISSDDAMGWQTGDNGAYQFWITPADLTALHFDRTVVTFECH